jgi:hypothetical protein
MRGAGSKEELRESFATRPLAGGSGPEGCRPFLFFMPLSTNVLEYQFSEGRSPSYSCSATIEP